MSSDKRIRNNLRLFNFARCQKNLTLANMCIQFFKTNVKVIRIKLLQK
jgi:hypothetical protein